MAGPETVLTPASGPATRPRLGDFFEHIPTLLEKLSFLTNTRIVGNQAHSTYSALDITQGRSAVKNARRVPANALRCFGTMRTSTR